MVEGAPAPVGVNNVAVSGVLAEGFTASSPSFSSEAGLIHASQVPLAGFDSPLVATEPISGNPLVDPGYLVYNPAFDLDGGDMMGVEGKIATLPSLASLSKPGDGISQIEQIAQQAWVTSESTTEVVVPDVQEVAFYLAQFAKSIELPHVQESLTEAVTDIVAEQQRDSIEGLVEEVRDSSDEAIAERVKQLAQEVERKDLLLELDEITQPVEEIIRESDMAKEEEIPSEEVAQDAGAVSEENQQAEDSEEEISNQNENVQPEKVEEQEVPPSADVVFPRVAKAVDRQREKVLAQLAEKEEDEARAQHRKVSARRVAKQYKEGAAISPARIQMGLSVEEPGILATSNAISQSGAVTAQGMVAAAQAVMTNAVELGEFGSQASDTAITMAVGEVAIATSAGSRRTVFR